jgi:hypothetical protein
MQNITNIEDATKLWSAVVGEFIIEFTQIEQLLHIVIEKYLADKFIANEHLLDSTENKINLMKLIMKEQLTDQKFLELEKLCQTILRLKEIRNLIVHNSLVLVVEQNNIDEIKVGEYEIGSLKKKKKSINYKKLLSETKELKETIKKISIIIVSATNCAY